MEKGYLIVSVYNENISLPIDSAMVRVIGDNYDNNFTTDINGKTISIALDAPLKKYSLTPQKAVRPYSVYTVEVSKSGYETTTINGVQVFPDQTSLQNVFLKENSSTVKVEAFSLNAVNTDPPSNNVINLPPNTLWEKTQGKTTRNNINSIENMNDTRVYPRTLIPEYVIVHDGAPSNTSAPNYYVEFPEYIKNVAAGEIYSTWPTEAIKANVYAIISFTLNRIYTEWYLSRGYKFTVTSSPVYDQSYVNNRTTFKSISDVVDTIFNYYIELPNTNYPFFAQYDDGINTNNPGWLSQWGSEDLASKGYTAVEILKHYYDDNLELLTAEDIEGLPTSFPGYNLKTGSCGEPVQKIQIMLNTISGNYPALPKIIPADGRYLDNTVTSVKKFQEIFGLPITGIVDFTTWYKISYIYIAVAKLLKGTT